MNALLKGYRLSHRLHKVSEIPKNSDCLSCRHVCFFYLTYVILVIEVIFMSSLSRAHKLEAYSSKCCYSAIHNMAFMSVWVGGLGPCELPAQKDSVPGSWGP